jgi:hypothetical protein
MILLNFSLYKFSRTSLLVVSFLVLMLLFHLINCVLFISTYDEVLSLLIRWNGKRYNFDRFSPQVSSSEHGRLGGSRSKSWGEGALSAGSSLFVYIFCSSRIINFELPKQWWDVSWTTRMSRRRSTDQFRTDVALFIPNSAGVALLANKCSSSFYCRMLFASLFNRRFDLWNIKAIWWWTWNQPWIRVSLEN